MARGSEDDAVAVVDQAIEALTKLRRTVLRGSGNQITGVENRDLVKATALSWIRSGRTAFPVSGGPEELEEIDALYRELFDFSQRAITRTRYKQTIRILKAALVRLRPAAVDVRSGSNGGDEGGYECPDFGPLVKDAAMQTILRHRWEETALCLQAGAHLAATVMMGALLEALFLTRANHLADPSVLYKAKSAPRDSKTGKTLPLSTWTLKPYIDVAHELKWIRRPARDVSMVLCEWRNYIHPAKQLAHNVSLEQGDTAMFWSIFTSLARQVLSIS